MLLRVVGNIDRQQKVQQSASSLQLGINESTLKSRDPITCPTLSITLPSLTSHSAIFVDPQRRLRLSGALTIHTKKWFVGAGLLGAPPIYRAILRGFDYNLTNYHFIEHIDILFKQHWISPLGAPPISPTPGLC